MATLLSASDVATALRSTPGWTGDTQEIARTVKAPEFLTGIRLVDAVADAAEQADHHPDIDIRWRSVTFRLATHSEGGVTRNDIELAQRINELAEQHACS
ncbi:MAG: 4a-hydroxytetrahydrobiopterin dehydratase [Micromonosporaceae bacterium]|nr:4a-hydroxytetrahydrobiopterin dehydratase [Micromonosporaceae bacterium]